MRRARVLLLVAALAAACSKREPPKPRTEPWVNPAYLASGSAAPAPSRSPEQPARTEKYALDPAASRIAFSLPAKEATPRGSLRAASGELTFSPVEPARGRARLSFDLTSIEMEGESEGGTTYTERALQWLELGSAVSAAVRERHRHAVFELASASGFDQPLGVASKSSGTVRGQLDLHGFRVPMELAVEVARGDSGAVTVRTRRPVTLRLSEHDIAPRGAGGELRSLELPLLGSKVGKEARLELELVFRPTGSP